MRSNPASCVFKIQAVLALRPGFSREIEFTTSSIPIFLEAYLSIKLMSLFPDLPRPFLNLLLRIRRLRLAKESHGRSFSSAAIWRLFVNHPLQGEMIIFGSATTYNYTRSDDRIRSLKPNEEVSHK